MNQEDKDNLKELAETPREPKDDAEKNEAKDELSPQHRAFIDNLVECLSATEAYLRVYGDCTLESAKASASRLLTNVNVKRELEERLNERSALANLHREKNIRFWEKVRDAPEGETLLDNVTVRVKYKKESDPDGNVTSTVQDPESGIQIKKAPDRMKASEYIARTLGQFVDKTQTELTGLNGGPIRRHSTYEIVDAPKRENDPKNPIAYEITKENDQ